MIISYVIDSFREKVLVTCPSTVTIIESPSCLKKKKERPNMSVIIAITDIRMISFFIFCLLLLDVIKDVFDFVIA